MPDASLHDHIAASAWHASLRLGFADDAGTTRLIERAHSGPLRVQKPLYPEGGKVCQVIVVHPPGGVVGGDQLALAANVGANSHALLTTPGAAKWYRANGKVSRQDVRLVVGADAALEWLPQETIFFKDAHVLLDQSIELAPDARYIGSEILCFGRRASGETFDGGTVRQRSQIRRGGKLVWWEQGVLSGSGTGMRSPFGLNGASVCATLIALGAPLPPTLLAQLRALDTRLAVSQIKSLLVARLLCDDSEAARQLMGEVWRAVRPHLMGREAQPPRIWST